MALITKDDLSVITGTPVQDAQFTAIYTAALRLVRDEYRADPEAATGRALDVLTSVILSVATRMLSNPTGARSVGLGSANITFVGAESLSAFELTPNESRRVRALRASRKVVMVPIYLPEEMP